MIYQVYVPPVRRVCNLPARHVCDPLGPSTLIPTHSIMFGIHSRYNNDNLATQGGYPTFSSVRSMTRLVRQSMANIEVL